MIRGERESPGRLQAIASFKRAASSRVAHLGDQENFNVQQVCLRFCLSIRLYAQPSGRGFQSNCFYRCGLKITCNVQDNYAGASEVMARLLWWNRWQKNIETAQPGDVRGRLALSSHITTTVVVILADGVWLCLVDEAISR
jgi:hypothetical protein